MQAPHIAVGILLSSVMVINMHAPALASSMLSSTSIRWPMGQINLDGAARLAQKPGLTGAAWLINVQQNPLKTLLWRPSELA
jgi:hypothetical protein